MLSHIRVHRLKVTTPTDLNGLIGRVGGNTVTRLFQLLQQQMNQEDRLKELLQQAKDGTPPEVLPMMAGNQPPPMSPQAMLGDFLQDILQAYLPEISAHNAKARDYFQKLKAISAGKLDPATLVITDEGVTIVEPMEDEEDPPKKRSHKKKPSAGKKPAAKKTAKKPAAGRKNGKKDPCDIPPSVVEGQGPCDPPPEGLLEEMEAQGFVID